MPLSSDLISFFKKLEEAEIYYFLLTNFTETNIQSGDIDLYVAPTERKKFLSLLEETGWLERREPVWKKGDRHYYFNLFSEQIICLDVKFCLCFPGKKITYWKASEPDVFISKRVKNTEGIFRPTGLIAILLYLAHICTEKKTVQSKYLERLKNYQELFIQEMNETEQIDNREIRVILANYEERLNFDLFETVIKKYFKSVSAKAVSPPSDSSLPTMYTVLCIGTDGSGKTTLVENLSRELPIKTERLYLGENEWLLPGIEWLYNRTKKNPFKCFINYLFYPLELLLRRLKVYARVQYRLVLIDRIPGFSFLGNKILMSVYAFVLPPVDLLVLLTGNATVLWNRKKENSPAEITADLAKWERVFAKMEASKKICVNTTDQTPYSIQKSVTRVIFSDPIFQERLFKKVS